MVTGFESPGGTGLHRQALHPRTQKTHAKWISRQAVSGKFPEFGRITEQIKIMQYLRISIIQFIPNHQIT